MNLRSVRRSRATCGRGPRAAHHGFTLLEMLIVVTAGLVMTLIAIPLVRTVQGNLKLRGAVSAVTGTIQSTRYQAIFQGCNTQVVFNSTALTAQAQTTQLADSTCGGAFTSLCNGASSATPCALPLSGSGNAVALDLDKTLTFTPGGRVLVAGGPASCPCTMVMTYSGKTATVTVSGFGSINVKYTP